MFEGYTYALSHYPMTDQLIIQHYTSGKTSYKFSGEENTVLNLLFSETYDFSSLFLNPKYELKDYILDLEITN